MRTLKIALAAAAIVGATSTAAFADQGGMAYGEQHGFGVAQENTPCSGAGAFSYFGPGENMAGGANGQQTGLNNSSLCGNRQGNLP